MKYKNPVKRGNKVHTYGFFDVYDTQTHEIWEVKRLGGGVSCSINRAMKQLGDYVNEGVLQAHKDWTLYPGGTTTTIDWNWFSVTDNDGSGQYVIAYWDAGVYQNAPGIVYYEYFYLPSPEEWAYAATIVGMVALVMSGAGAGAGAGVGIALAFG